MLSREETKALLEVFDLFRPSPIPFNAERALRKLREIAGEMPSKTERSRRASLHAVTSDLVEKIHAQVKNLPSDVSVAELRSEVDTLKTLVDTENVMID